MQDFAVIFILLPNYPNKYLLIFTIFQGGFRSYFVSQLSRIQLQVGCSAPSQWDCGTWLSAPIWKGTELQSFLEYSIDWNAAE